MIAPDVGFSPPPPHAATYHHHHGHHHDEADDEEAPAVRPGTHFNRVRSRVSQRPQLMGSGRKARQRGSTEDPEEALNGQRGARTTALDQAFVGGPLLRVHRHPAAPKNRMLTETPGPRHDVGGRQTPVLRAASPLGGGIRTLSPEPQYGRGSSAKLGDGGEAGDLAGGASGALEDLESEASQHTMRTISREGALGRNWSGYTNETGAGDPSQEGFPTPERPLSAHSRTPEQRMSSSPTPERRQSGSGVGY